MSVLLLQSWLAVRGRWHCAVWGRAGTLSWSATPLHDAALGPQRAGLALSSACHRPVARPPDSKLCLALLPIPFCCLPVVCYYSPARLPPLAPCRTGGGVCV